MMNQVLTATRLTMSFGKTRVLDGLDFDLAPGQVTALLGTNGAGKSTLLRLAMGMLVPDSGQLCVLGEAPSGSAGAARLRTGYVPDVPDAYGWMTAAELFRFLEPHYDSWDREHCARLCERLAIPETTSLRRLSKGEGMKVMLTAALAHHPSLLLLDEPFAGLDPIVRDEVLEGIIGVLGDHVSVLCSTHELEFASRLADRVAVLANGKITHHAPIEDFTSHRNAPMALKQAIATAGYEAVS